MIVEKFLQHAESWTWQQAHHQPTTPWHEGGMHVIHGKSLSAKSYKYANAKQATNVFNNDKQHLTLNWNIIYVNWTGYQMKERLFLMACSVTISFYVNFIIDATKKKQV